MRTRSSWQGIEDDGRFDLLEIRNEIHPEGQAALPMRENGWRGSAGYSERLEEALEKAEQDPRYMVSPAVDSYHTVWFEAHEDFLLTLGRSREEEGSA